MHLHLTEMVTCGSEITGSTSIEECFMWVKPFFVERSTFHLLTKALSVNESTLFTSALTQRSETKISQRSAVRKTGETLMLIAAVLKERLLESCEILLRL